MKLYVKIGTYPASFENIIGKRKLPKIGDTLKIKIDGKITHVYCYLIKDLGYIILYYVEKR